MQSVFESINSIFAFIGPLSDFLWDFPTNFDWYASIPLLGNFSFAIILLLGSGIYFSFCLGFMQVTHFKKTKKRIFKMAPIHHHFELCGMGERKVVAMFWAATLVFCLLAILVMNI